MAAIRVLDRATADDRAAGKAAIQAWECLDTVRAARGLAPRIIPVREVPGEGIEGTWSDYFCGGGGSTGGLHLVAGCFVRIAVNHWDLAIANHNNNFPMTDHDRADVARTDPRRYARTDFAWFSPECTRWTVARGDKCDYDRNFDQLDMFDDDAADPQAEAAKWRSRMLMIDVVRFSAHHRYKGVIVENVTDILKWANLKRWLRDMRKEGYKHKIVVLNSAFASALGDPAPQLRDRVYFVFWREEYPTPDFDKWLSPPGWCPSCGEVVMARYTAKPGKPRAMRYGPKRGQYFYRCPKVACRGVPVEPYVLPAAAAIDPRMGPGQVIGERSKPLAAKTRARIAAGLRRYRGRPITAEVAGHTFERRPGVRTWPVDRPLSTQHTTESKALACPPLLVPTGGAWRDTASPVNLPMMTRTTTENDGFVVPPQLDMPPGSWPNRAMVVPLEGRAGPLARDIGLPLAAQTTRHEDALVLPLRNNGVTRPVYSAPTPTFCAGGGHVGYVMRNNTPRDGADGANLVTPLTEPIRALTTAGHQSLLSMKVLEQVLMGYDSGRLRPLSEPMPTQTTVEGDAVLGIDVDIDLEVDECTLRMLAVHEIQAGMAFDPTYSFISCAKRDQVAMLGNAVTSNAARDLAGMLMEAICGINVGEPFAWAYN